MLLEPRFQLLDAIEYTRASTWTWIYYLRWILEQKAQLKRTCKAGKATEDPLWI